MDISREDHLRSLSRTGDNRLDLMRREVLGLIDDTISLGQATTPDKGQRLDHQLVVLLHIVDLTESTIKDNSRLFKNIDEVPRQAFTMGLKNIMNAKKILILANGANKAKAVYGLVKGEVTEKLPASVLQLHPDCTLVCDEVAAEFL